jgi:hypothetical protein
VRAASSTIASRRQQTLPTFFIIGAPKAGTTSLHHYLEQHPQIQMSSVKEPSYFAPAPDERNLKRGITRLDKYEQLFNPSVPVRGEASTNYAEYPFRQGVPERIRALVPDAKFIYLVRDPVSRTLSHYRHMYATGSERRTLEDVCGDLSDPRSPCLCASLYALQLELYLRQFPPERVLVLDHAHLLSDRRTTLRRIFAFLNVEDSFDCSRFDAEFLKGDEHREYPLWLARLVGHAVQPHSSWLPPRFRRLMRLGVERIFLSRLERSLVGDGLRAQLEMFFAADAERLRALTGDRFASWSV